VPDRLPSDHDAVETIRAGLERAGGLDRPKVVLPADRADAVPAGEVVRLVLDGTTYHAQVREGFDGTPELPGAYGTPTLARDPGAGENHLPAWVADADVSLGGSVLLDVVTAGFKYGLRAPGERAVYEATPAPDDGLASIAEDLTE